MAGFLDDAVVLALRVGQAALSDQQTLARRGFEFCASGRDVRAQLLAAPFGVHELGIARNGCGRDGRQQKAPEQDDHDDDEGEAADDFAPARELLVEVHGFHQAKISGPTRSSIVRARASTSCCSWLRAVVASKATVAWASSLRAPAWT